MIRTINIEDKEYPESLKNIYDPPKCLYVKGTIPQGRCIAVVGTRQVSPYGIGVTKKVTQELVKKGYVIVSGMAIGVDAVAHWTALENGGKTIAVLGLE